MHTKRAASILWLSLFLTGFGTTIGCAGRIGVYDRTHGDWHSWDSTESRAYREYWVHNGHPYRRYIDLDQDEQNTYWAWRHGGRETR